MKKMLMSLFLVGGFAFNGNALDVVITGTQVDFIGQEPVTKTDGSALDDLAGCRILYSDGISDTVVVDLPASSPNGGGAINYSFTLPGVQNKEFTYDVFGVCYDNSPQKNTSKKEDAIIRQVEVDLLAPSGIK